MSPLTLSRQRHGMLTQCLAERAAPLAAAPLHVYGLDPSRHASGAIPTTSSSSTTLRRPRSTTTSARYVADELLPLLLACAPRRGAADGYAASEQEIFERYVGAIVRSMDGNERRAWHLFYDNTLAALRAPDSRTAARRARVHARFHRRLPRDLRAGAPISSPRWRPRAFSTWRRASASCRCSSLGTGPGRRCTTAPAHHRLRSQPGAGGARRGLPPAAAAARRAASSAPTSSPTTWHGRLDREAGLRRGHRHPPARTSGAGGDGAGDGDAVGAHRAAG